MPVDINFFFFVNQISLRAFTASNLSERRVASSSHFLGDVSSMRSADLLFEALLRSASFKWGEFFSVAVIFTFKFSAGVTLRPEIRTVFQQLYSIFQWIMVSAVSLFEVCFLTYCRLFQRQCTYSVGIIFVSTNLGAS